MMQNNKRWKVLKRKLIHGEPFPIYKETVKLPTGKTSTYVVNRSKDAAAVLLVPQKGFILLTYQYRFPINAWIYDLPGGKLNKHENPKSAAIRECIEETGYRPIKLKRMLYYYIQPSRSNAKLHLFFSDKAILTNKKKEFASEKTKSTLVKTSDIESLIESNIIVDPALLIAWSTAKIHGYV